MTAEVRLPYAFVVTIAPRPQGIHVTVREDGIRIIDDWEVALTRQVESKRKVTRRGIMGLAAALGGAAATGALAPSRASAANALMIGTPNTASATTQLGGNFAGQTLGIYQDNASSGTAAIVATLNTPSPSPVPSAAIYAATEHPQGSGVIGSATAEGQSGLLGTSTQGYGITAESGGPAALRAISFANGSAVAASAFGDGPAVLATHNGSGTAVRAVGNLGVWGEGPSLGVYGISSERWGVYGVSFAKEPGAPAAVPLGVVPPAVNARSRPGGVYGNGDVYGDGVTGVAYHADAAGVWGQCQQGPGVVALNESATAAAASAQNLGGGHAVLGTSGGPKATVRAANGGAGDGVNATSAGGRGGSFKGKLAAIRLQPSTETSHPVTGALGDLFVAKSGDLWYCKRGGKQALWVKLA